MVYQEITSSGLSLHIYPSKINLVLEIVANYLAKLCFRQIVNT